MDTNHVFYEHQYGSRQNQSTEQALIILVDKIIHSLDKGDIIISVFLDLKKAFDTVGHHILLKKLYAYGIRETLSNGLKDMRSVSVDCF